MIQGTDIRCRAWCVTIWRKSIENMGLGHLLNENGFPKDGTGKELTEQIRELWACSGKGRTSGATACMSKNDGFHIHMGVYTPNPMKRKDVALRLGNAHVDEQRGTKEQLVKYIKKDGDFAEKEETVLYCSDMDGVQDNQGCRNDLSRIDSMIQEGKTPNEIMDCGISYRKYEKLIRDAYFRKREKETPFIRDIKVYWHVGLSGSGKSYVANQIIEKFGEDELYLVSDYDCGGLDRYNGQKVLFLDEFRGQIRYSTLLAMLQGYKQQFHARYTNITGLWNEVHITSVLPPELVYSNMVESHKDLDTIKQLLRRITEVVYHYKFGSEYREYHEPIDKYVDYTSLQGHCMGQDDFVQTDMDWD